MVDFKGLGDITIDVAGTPEPLSATQILTPDCSITAPSTNTGLVYIFGINQTSSSSGVKLRPGESTAIIGPKYGGTTEEFDLARIYVDAATSGDKVTVAYWARRA